jgi:putative ABC transport system permease protein
LIELAMSVGGSVTLISVSAGVEKRIGELVSSPAVRSSGLLDVDRIETILGALTTAVLIVALLNLVFTAFVLGQLVMRARAKEIAVRKTDGADTAPLLREFMRDALLLAVAGALFGEACGLLTAWILNQLTPLPTEITVSSRWLVWPLAVVATLVANYIPARAAARMSPRDFFGRR